MLNHRYVRVLLPSLVIGIYYWSLMGRVSVQDVAKPEYSMIAPDESRNLLEQSTTLWREGKYEESMSVTLKLHQAYPQNHIYLERLASIYAKLGHHKAETQMWEKFLQYAPIPVEACPQIGQAYQKQGLTEEALDAFRRCLAQDEQNTDSIFFLAQALELSKRFDEAAEMYKRGTALAPEYYDLRVGLARVRLHQGDYSKAMEIAGKVLEESQTNVDAMLVLGLTNWRTGDRVQAKKYLQQGIELAEGYADFYVALGGIAEQENDIERAIRDYKKLLSLDPGNRQIAMRLDALTGGQK